MTYVETEVKESKDLGKKTVKKAYKQAVNRTSTAYTLWLLIVKHKVALLVIWAVVMTLLYIFPPLPYIIVGVLFP